MADAPLDPEARALWRRVTETVRPLGGRRALPSSPLHREARSDEAIQPVVRGPGSLPPDRARGRDDDAKAKPAPPATANTLDGTWDKRLREGTVTPDVTIDLHGYTLAAAHGALEAGLTRALGAHARLVLLVTGRPPPPGRSRLDNPLRGVIRASIGDWLHHSRHAGRIAAVRNAHPRHGGAGALYVILRRRREPA